jgi:hypothetical protein
LHGIGSGAVSENSLGDLLMDIYLAIGFALLVLGVLVVNRLRAAKRICHEMAKQNSPGL